MTSPAPPPARPQAVTIAFWLLVGGAAVLAVGGLFSATLSFDAVRDMAGYAGAEAVSDQQIRDRLTLYRGAGVFCVLAAIALAVLAARTRRGDPRFRRATLGLVAATVLLVVLLAIFVGTHLLSVVALLPILAGALVLVRPAAGQWFEQQAQRSGPESGDG